MSEREARLKAEARVRELEMELDLVKRQLEQFQVKHMRRLHKQRKKNLEVMRRDYELAHSFSRHLYVNTDEEDIVDN